MLLKNTVTQPGIDPGTVRLVAQLLNHYGTPGPYPPSEKLKFNRNHLKNTEDLLLVCGPEWLSRYGDWLRAGRSGNRMCELLCLQVLFYRLLLVEAEDELALTYSMFKYINLSKPSSFFTYHRV
jgi:hypothetical protein